MRCWLTWFAVVLSLKSVTSTALRNEALVYRTVKFLTGVGGEHACFDGKRFSPCSGRVVINLMDISHGQKRPQSSSLTNLSRHARLLARVGQKLCAYGVETLIVGKSCDGSA